MIQIEGTVKTKSDLATPHGDYNMGTEICDYCIHFTVDEQWLA